MSTQVGLAAEALTERGEAVYVTRAHGGTPIGELLRDVSLSNVPRSALTDLLLSRTIHAELAEDIQARRAKGITCLVDRSPASMWAYQVRASGLDTEIARPIIEADFKTFDPDILIIYTASLSILKRHIDRLANSKSDFFESKPDDYHRLVIDGYVEAADQFGGVLIDASGSIQQIHAQTMSLIAQAF